MKADTGTSEQVNDFLRFAANGDAVASDWLTLWHRYNHAVDDVIDNATWDFESLLALFVTACMCYSHPFYALNRLALQMPVLLATRTYGDSVKWERDPALWKRQFAEVTRHAGNDVICAVAMLTGGWEHLTKVSAPLLASCFVYHADLYGRPT